MTGGISSSTSSLLLDLNEAEGRGKKKKKVPCTKKNLPVSRHPGRKEEKNGDS